MQALFLNLNSWSLKHSHIWHIYQVSRIKLVYIGICFNNNTNTFNINKIDINYIITENFHNLPQSDESYGSRQSTAMQELLPESEAQLLAQARTDTQELVYIHVFLLIMYTHSDCK